MIRYAHHKQLFDHPGGRRIHKQVVPRGGGMGIVIAVLSGLIFIPRISALGLDVSVVEKNFWIISLGVISIVGWLDDHYDLSVWSRIIAQIFAAGCALAPFVLVQLNSSAGPWSVLITTILLSILILVSINFHNFMDGANGLLGLQALFVFLALFVFTFERNVINSITLCLILSAAAVAAFLPFNFPQAKIFLGDIGSCFLGLLIAICSWYLWREEKISAAQLCILHSSFLIDASSTLIYRMYKRKAFWRSHREHLYQWLIRSGWSHQRTSMVYLSWNLLIVMPCLVLISHQDLGFSAQVSVTGFVLALGFIIWLRGKRAVLNRIQLAPYAA